MKHLAILVVFLLMGCQTNNNIAPNDITSPKPVIETDQEMAKNSQKESTDDKKDKPEKPEVEGFIVQKPILCGPADVFLEGIERTSQEKPIGFWIDSQYQNKVMLLRNADTGSVSVLEFIKNEYACFISVGQQSQMVPTEPTKKGETTYYQKVLD
jgi:hypothetical protein